MYKLRELERNDVPIINRWRNNRAIRDSLGGAFCFVNEDVDNKWYDNYLNNRHKTLRCAVVEDGKDEILALVTLSSIDRWNQSAVFHIMVSEDSQGKGIGTFAVKDMVNHAFNDLNLSRIELTVLEDNLRAQHLYEKVGFKREGVLRLAKYNNGQFKNMIVYSILKPDRNLYKT